MRDYEAGSEERENNKLQTKSHHLIDELLVTEKWGDARGMWVPAIKEAVALGEIEKLSKLRAKFPYSFEHSLNFLRKEEREVVRRWCQLESGEREDTTNN